MNQATDHYIYDYYYGPTYVMHSLHWSVLISTSFSHIARLSPYIHTQKYSRTYWLDPYVLMLRNYKLLPLSRIICRFRFSCHKFDSICRKYVQYLYL